MIEYARNVIGMTDANSTEFDSSTPYPVVISMPEMNGKDLGGTMRCGLRRSVIYRTYEIADACTAADALAAITAASGTGTSSVGGGGTGTSGSSLNGTLSGKNASTVTLAAEMYGFSSSESSDDAAARKRSRVVQSNHSTDASAALVSDVHDFSNDFFYISERHRHRYEVNPVYVTQLQQNGLHFTVRDASESSPASKMGVDDAAAMGVSVSSVRMEVAELTRSSHPFYLGTQYHPEFKSRPDRPSPPLFALVFSAGRKAGLCGKLSDSSSNQLSTPSKRSYSAAANGREPSSSTVAFHDAGLLWKKNALQQK